MTPNELDHLLSDLKLSRDWLSGATGISRRTIEGWKYRGAIPANKVRIIEQALTRANKSNISITFDEWQACVRAMRLAGFTDFDEFLKSLVIEKAREFDEGLLAAEDPAPYRKNPLKKTSKKAG